MLQDCWISVLPEFLVRIYKHWEWLVKLLAEQGVEKNGEQVA